MIVDIKIRKRTYSTVHRQKSYRRDVTETDKVRHTVKRGGQRRMEKILNIKEQRHEVTKTDMSSEKRVRDRMEK